jgi:hypothetical protein
MKQGVRKNTKLKILYWALLIMLFFAHLFLASNMVMAECTLDNPCVGLGNTGGTALASGATTEPKTPQDYLGGLYDFLLGFVGVAAMGSIVYGGVLYMTSAGNPSGVGKAKDAIWNGVIGILVAAFGYLILTTINPDLAGGFDLQNIVDKNLNQAQQGQ